MEVYEETGRGYVRWTSHCKGKESVERLAEIDYPNEKPFILSIIPAIGYVATYDLNEAPWVMTVPVVAWGIVREYLIDSDGAKEYRSVEPIVCEEWEGILERANETQNFSGLLQVGDTVSLEQMRQKRMDKMQKRTG